MSLCVSSCIEKMAFSREKLRHVSEHSSASRRARVWGGAEKCAGWISGVEMSPVEPLLEVFSSQWKQLRAADLDPNLGARPAEKKRAEAPVCW